MVLLLPIVLAQAMMEEGLDLITKGINPIAIEKRYG